MPSFTDDFNRADGGLGSGWVVRYGSAAISGQAAVLQPSTSIYPADFSETGDLEISLDAGVSNNGTGAMQIIFGFTASGGTCHIIHGGVGLLYTNFTVAYYDQGGLHNLEAFSADRGPGYPWHLTFRRVGNTYSIYDSGVLLGSHTDAQPNSGGVPMIQSEGDTLTIDNVNIATYVAQSMVITPDPLWVGGGPCLVTATGTNTEWTDGESPSTTFSADHGEVEVYRFVSATEWELIYTPAEYIGTITFSETQYGLSDQINGVLTPPEEGSNGLCQLTPAGAEVVNRAGLLTPDGAVLTTDTALGSAWPNDPDLLLLNAIGDLLSGFYITHIPGMTLTLGEAIDKLWLAVNGSADLTGAEIGDQTNDSLNSMLTALRLLFYDDETFTDISLKQLLTAIEAISAPDLSAIRADIGIEGQQTWTSLLQVLLGMWGPGADTITTLGTRFDSLVTLSQWNLGNVKDWIDAIPAADVTAVLDAIADLDNVVDTSTTNIRSDIAASTLLIVGLGTDLGNLTSLTTALSGEVDTLSDKIDALSDKIDALRAPVWPGVANVTMGTPVALIDQLVLDGPMDGVVVAVTSPPVGLGQYRVGGRRLDYGQMRLAFETDNGDMEGWQYFGFEEAVYTPHAMAQAAKCRFQLLGGLGGTVTPWVRS